KAIVYASEKDGIVSQPFGGAGGTKHILDWDRNNLAVPTQVVGDGLIFFGDAGTQTGLDILSVPIAGGSLKQVIKGPLTDAEPQVSPDGRWLAYASTETGGYEVFVQPYPMGGAKWQISTGGGRQPSWRHDGRELFFVTNDRKLLSVDVRP